MSDKARDNMHMSEAGVHNLELSDYHRLGDTQETTVAMQTKAWLQEMPPNYSAPERGSQPGCPIPLLYTYTRWCPLLVLETG